MAKCMDCNLCLDFVWIDNVRYLQCSLCKRLYEVVGKKIKPYTPIVEVQKPKQSPVKKYKPKKLDTNKYNW